MKTCNDCWWYDHMQGVCGFMGVRVPYNQGPCEKFKKDPFDKEDDSDEKGRGD